MMDLAKLSLALQAGGAGLQGGDPGLVLKRNRDEAERLKRKEAVDAMLGTMGLSGPQQALIEAMPVDMAMSTAQGILDHRRSIEEQKRREVVIAGRQAAARQAEEAKALARAKAMGGYVTRSPIPGVQLGPTKAAAQGQQQVKSSVSQEAIIRAMQDPKLRPADVDYLKEIYQMDVPADRRIVEGADGFKYYADTGERVLPNVQQSTEAPSAAEQQIARLTELGLDRDMAILISDGVLKTSRDPVSGEAQMVDARTGQPWTGLPAQTSAHPTLPQAPVPPQQRVPTGDSPRTLPSPTVPEADYAGAMGVEGFGSNALNAGADALGINLPFPERQEATTALTNLALRTKTFMQQAFPGRTSVQLMQELDKITTQPNRILMGEQRGRDMLEQTAGMIDALIAQEQRKLRNPRGYTPQMRADAQANIDALEQLSADYRAVLETMGSGSDGNRTSSGVSWRIVE